MSLVTDRHDWWWSAQIGGLHTDPLQRWFGSKSYTTHVYEPTAVSIARRLSIFHRERERDDHKDPQTTHFQHLVRTTRGQTGSGSGSSAGIAILPRARSKEGLCEVDPAVPRLPRSNIRSNGSSSCAGITCQRQPEGGSAKRCSTHLVCCSRGFSSSISSAGEWTVPITRE